MTPESIVHPIISDPKVPNFGSDIRFKTLKMEYYTVMGINPPWLINMVESVPFVPRVPL